MKLLMTLLVLLSLVNASDEYITTKTSCIQQSEHAGKTLDEQKVVLINQAKQEALSELYGQMLYSKTDLKNGELISQEIRQRAVGSIRVKGNPKFYNGENFGEVCADITAYITKEDLKKYSPKTVKLEKYCFNDPSVSMNKIKQEAKYSAYKEIISQYKPSLKLSGKQAENYIHGFKISNDNFDFDTASYCFDAVATVLPYELELKPSERYTKKITDTAAIKPIKKEVSKNGKLLGTAYFDVELDSGETIYQYIKYNDGFKVNSEKLNKTYKLYENAGIKRGSTTISGKLDLPDDVGQNITIMTGMKPSFGYYAIKWEQNPLNRGNDGYKKAKHYYIGGTKQTAIGWQVYINDKAIYKARKQVKVLKDKDGKLYIDFKINFIYYSNTNSRLLHYVKLVREKMPLIKFNIAYSSKIKKRGSNELLIERPVSIYCIEE